MRGTGYAKKIVAGRIEASTSFIPCSSPSISSSVSQPAFLGNIVGAGHNMDDARLEIDHVGSKAEEYLWTCLTTNTATNAR
jgi:hypothetical protein